MLYFIFLWLFCINYVQSKQIISLGLIRDEHDSQTIIPFATSVYANNLIHTRIHYHMIDRILTEDAFESSKMVCNMTESKRGIQAIISYSHSKRLPILESISAQMEIPHIQLSWDPEPSHSLLTSLNFFPDMDLLAEGISAIVDSLQWKSFVILYEDTSSFHKLKYVLKLEPYSADKKRNRIIMRQLGPGPDYRSVFKDIKHIPETNIILDCRADHIYDILEQAQSVRMLEIFHSYFITSLDTHTVNLTALGSKANITTIRIFSPEFKFVEQAIKNWELAERNIFDNHVKYDPYQIKTSTILMHDAIEHLIGVINELSERQPVETTHLRCDKNEKFNDGFRIMSFMKVKPLIRPLSGPIQFSKNGSRIDFNIYLIKGTKNVTLNSWRAQNQNLVSNRTQQEYEKAAEEMLKGEDLVIASRIVVPYLNYKEDHKKRLGNDRFEGYALDLIDAISLLVGFNYNFELVKDNEIGTYNPVLGQWNGLIGEITEHKAHMAISDIAMTAQRQQVVDFSSPFINLGIGLMIKKPTVKEIPLFSFLDPFTKDVWVYTGTLLLAISTIFYLAYRLAPYEWVNPHPCNTEPDELEIEWTYKNCTWLVLGSLMQQGCDILPRSPSTRISLALWWFFSMIMFNSYTANLAAFLTSEKAGITVKNVEELAKQTMIKYGCVEHSDTYNFFKYSDYTTYRKMWNNMITTTNPSVFVKSDVEGVKRVLTTKDSLYAFLTESTMIDYEVKTKCDLKSVGNWLNTISYAIAMPMNAGYLGIINSAILNLSESGELDKMREKWWVKKRKEKICEIERKSEDSQSLKLNRVAGVFLVTGVGIMFAYLVAIVEFLWNVKDIAVEEKTTYLEALKHELKFVINFRLKKKRTKLKISRKTSERFQNKEGLSGSTNYLRQSGSLYNVNKINNSD